LPAASSKPEDFVISTVIQYSVRAAAAEFCIEIRFEDDGVDEVVIVESIAPECGAPASKQPWGKRS
jgi:GDP-D-mannose dehydratase